MICVFAEKFDVGIKIVAALGNLNFHGTTITSKNVEQYKTKLEKELKPNGYIDISYNGDDYAVTWGQGHLCTLKQAKDYDPEYVHWGNIPIPFFPEEYEIKIKEQMDWKTKKLTGNPDPWTCKQLSIVKKLFEKCEYIISATDDDREGELIFAYVYQIIGVYKPYKRVIFDSQTKEGYIKAFSRLKESSEVKNIEYAGRSRAIADWLVGINLSVLMSLKYGGYGKDSLITIGRVQTPVLNLLVQRELAIKNFKSHPFWYISAKFINAKGESFSAKHEISQIEKKSEADELFSKVKGYNGTVIKYDKIKKTKEVPLLYNISTLSVDANKKYGISANDTLNTVQELYMDGLVTYPRTESTCLTDDMGDVVDSTLEMLSSFEEYKKYITPIEKKDRNYTKRHFNTAKVESHFAIIPTDNKPPVLEGRKKQIYDLIAKSLIRIIYKPAILEDTKVEVDVNGEKFKTSGTVVQDSQWMSVDSMPSGSNILPVLNIGDTLTGTYELKEGKTNPPERYTDATLTGAMATAGKALDDDELKKVLESANKGGIGRPSTRSAIIESVVNRYAIRKGKTIIPTEKGIKLIEILPVQALKSAELTAEWELRLDKIAKGEDNINDFISDLEDTTTEWCQEIKNDTSGVKICGENKTELLSITCPVCGKQLRKLPWGVCCSGFDKNDEKSCKFSIGYEIAGAKLSDKDITDILLKGSSRIINSFKSKTGKNFTAKLILDKDTHKLQFSFDLDSGLLCPKCKSKIEITGFGWKCSNKECDFIVWNTMLNKKLSDKDKTDLIKSGKTKKITGFKSKAGKSFDAVLMLDENFKVKFDFSKK